MKILISYRTIPTSPGWATGDLVVKAFRALGHDAHAYTKYYQESRWIEDPTRLLEEEWDLYLQMECGDGDIFYSELKDVRAKKRISWWFDVALYPARWEYETAYISSEINFVANYNYLNKNSYTYYLPYAADDTLHYRPVHLPKKYDFALVGSDRPERRQLILSLRERGIDAHLISNVYREAYIDALASSRVVINDVAGGGNGLLPMRYFEAVMAGSFLLTPYDDGEFCLDTLPAFVCHYADIEHLILKCKNFNFEHDEHKRQIRQNIVLDKHTYKNRCQEILEIIQQ